jgi:hypothetical protein
MKRAFSTVSKFKVNLEDPSELAMTAAVRQFFPLFDNPTKSGLLFQCRVRLFS